MAPVKAGGVVFFSNMIPHRRYNNVLPLVRDMGGVFSKTYINWTLSGISAVDLTCKNL